jgi:membrane-bound lytic murein transglycosylase A
MDYPVGPPQMRWPLIMAAIGRHLLTVILFAGSAAAGAGGAAADGQGKAVQEQRACDLASARSESSARLASCSAAAKLQFAARHGRSRRALPDDDSAPGQAPRPPGPLKIADTELEPLAFADLAGWAADDHAAAFAAFLVSCRPITRQAPPAAETAPVAAALVPVCRRALAEGQLAPAAARAFFEANFRPLRISRLGDPQGFLTAYYEPVVEGSRWPTGEFRIPMYRKPDDLVAPAQRPGAAFPNKGEVGRLDAEGKLVPYFDRGEIEDGALDGRHLEICWLKDPVAAFSIHIQGSAQVRLEDGLIVRLNYAAHNGHRYTPVGRILIERNIVPRDEMSLDRIRQWMQEHADEARELRRKNQSFVFFRIAGLGEDGEAVGGQGVQLSPWRSIAVDRPMHAYGTPFFIDAELPLSSASARTPFRQLMIAQDTGSAIVGPARADLFLGAGNEAGRVAGRIRHPGRFTMLVPREIDPVEAGRHMPVPRAQPVIAEAAKADVPAEGKGERQAQGLRHEAHHVMRPLKVRDPAPARRSRR